MDPMQALAEIDAALQTLSVNRQTHAHLINCVATVRTELQASTDAKLALVATPKE